MTLQVITLAEMKAHSGLAEVQALTADTLAPLEAEALDLLEGEVNRRLTVDTTNVAVRVQGSGLVLLPLPERLATLETAISDTRGDITDSVELLADGWLMKAEYVTFRSAVTVTGKWGLACPAKAKRVLMDVVEALAVRKGDSVSRRDELAPWGSVSDGALQASRDSDRAATLENLLRYDAKARLRGLYRPTRVGLV